MKTRRNALRVTTRLLIAGTMTVALAACGGGSSGGGSDVDGDGIDDSIDDDIDGDGILNEEDDDANGNGIADADEEFTPFVPDETVADSFIEPSAASPCGSARGTDSESADNTWNNNCTISRRNQFADSLYSAGIQRIVYCSVDSVPGANVNAYTDGEFGPATQAGVTSFQNANTLGADGAVGPQTWANLQTKLERVAPGAAPSATQSSFDGYAVMGDRCGDAVLFYQEVSLSEDGIQTELGGWTLARGAGSTERVPFSIAQPFNRID